MIVSLAIVMVFLYGYGWYLKIDVFDGNPMYRDTPLPALPYIYWFHAEFKSQLASEVWNSESEETAPTAARSETMEPAVSIAEPTVGQTVDPVDTLESSEPVESTAANMPDVLPPETGKPVEDDKLVPIRYELGAVADDYFSDALFIGDSRTDGLSMYGAIDGADYFANKGMTVFSAFSTTARDGKTKLEALLEEKTYGKIYIMLGINEIGTNFEMVMKQYKSVIAKLKELVPDAIIVIEASLSITEEKSKDTWYLTAERIHELNELQSTLADGEKIFFLDVNELFCDEDGYLLSDLSGDGVHLTAKHYVTWADWLRENAYVPVFEDPDGARID